MKNITWGYTQNELKRFYEQNKIIVFKYNNVYQLEYSQAQQQFYFVKTRFYFVGLTAKNRHYILTPKEANHILKANIFNE